ncbi:MAG: cation:dicarboxylase symporter family transporter [Thiocapsa sp.]|nr:cation:dicarboxylase symporter family transporter [Thiocapsa sp.]MCG6896597.1 cation:dicarboxylase symporter family transporter [Thiocapsa sp.]MCG6983770.1 cation:dicarboxylase symporter family transporter [Thiocapsa sp.]
MSPVLARLARTSLSSRILVGLALGVFVGLFFGEPAAALQPLADVYIRLMQMTVLPYLLMALIVGFGQLEAIQAKNLALRGGALYLVTLLLAFAVVAAMPAAFPSMQSATFFSHALEEPRQPFSIADLYFTANPFHSLANAVVPAVVLFSTMIGIGLIGLEDKESVLKVLRVFNASLVRITQFVVGLTPVGVFAIGAVTAGTMAPETFARLEAYFLVLIAASLLLAFWILPLLVTALTPFTYREVMGVARDALLTAFLAGSAFIVLPILVERTKALLRERGLLSPESDSAADVLMPILFNFPNAGRLLTLLFVPFAAWLAGSALTSSDYWVLLAAGVPSYFAKAQVALPFLLDLFEIPHDLFQLYIPTTIIGGKFDSLVTAMNLLTFALLGAAAMGGFLVLRRAALIRAGIAIIAGILVTVLAVQLLLGALIDTGYHKDDVLRRMHLARHVAETIVHRDRSGVLSDLTTLERIRERGTLRVGYERSNLPFSFFNAEGQLVGFDVELAVALAEALGVTAEFVPVEWPELAAVVADGLIDLMPGVWYRPYWFSSLRLSEPYHYQTMGIAVRDERRHEFMRIEALHRSRGLRIGIPLDRSQVASSIARYFGNTPVELVPLPTAVPFFEGRQGDLDGYLMPAEGASAWTLLHPQFTVAVPQPDPVKIPTAFGLPLGARDLAEAVDEWVVFATSEGSVKRAHDYWVLGQGAEDQAPRWSILRDVLGWGP